MHTFGSGHEPMSPNLVKYSFFTSECIVVHAFDLVVIIASFCQCPPIESLTPKCKLSYINYRYFIHI